MDIFSCRIDVPSISCEFDVSGIKIEVPARLCRGFRTVRGWGRLGPLGPLGAFGPVAAVGAITWRKPISQREAGILTIQ